MNSRCEILEDHPNVLVLLLILKDGRSFVASIAQDTAGRLKALAITRAPAGCRGQVLHRQRPRPGYQGGSMKRFRILWTDPETGERRDDIKEFADTPTVTAREWAEDWAYSAADKRCDFVITEIK